MCGWSPCLWQKTDVGAHWWLIQPFYEWLPRILGLKRHATLLTRSPPSSQPPTCHHPPDSACWLFLCLFGPGLSVAMQFVKMHHKVNNWIFELLRPRTFDSIFSFQADAKEAKQGERKALCKISRLWATQGNSCGGKICQWDPEMRWH